MDIITKYVDFSLNNLEVYTKMIMGKYFKKDIFKQYIEEYANVRYYNEEIENKSTLEATLNNALEKVYLNDPSNVSKFILELFKMFYYLDGVKKYKGKQTLQQETIELNEIRQEKLGIYDDNFVSNFKKEVLSNWHRKEKYLKKTSSNDFYITCKKIRNISIYIVSLNDNISIPSLYSEYAIDKVKTESIVAVNKLLVEYYLVSSLILKNIIKGNFKKKYLVEFSPKLLETISRKNKFKEIFNTDIIKENIILSIRPVEFLSHEEEICSLIKEGYSFGLTMNQYEDYIMIKDRNTDYFTNLFLNGELKELVDSNNYIVI